MSHEGRGETVVPMANDVGRILYLDGWRGIAIALVLLAHFFHVPWFDSGRFGVDIFFVLSGMLMADILFVKRMPLARFYKRRISRVFPVFFIFLSSISLASYFFHLSDEHNHFIYNLLFVRSYYPVNPNIWHAGLPIGHLWSLNVEEHCYLVLSLVTLVSFFKNKEFLPILFLGLCSLGLHFLYAMYPAIASQNYLLKTEIVASHLLISGGYSLIRHRMDKFVKAWMPIAAFLLALLCYTPLSPLWFAKWLLSPFLLAFAVNHLGALSAGVQSLLCFYPLRLIGVWSFSIYLWQQPLYYYGTKGGDLFFFAGPLLLILSLLLGAGSYYFIENPMRRYLNQHW